MTKMHTYGCVCLYIYRLCMQTWAVYGCSVQHHVSHILGIAIVYGIWPLCWPRLLILYICVVSSAVAHLNVSAQQPAAAKCLNTLLWIWPNYKTIVFLVSFFCSSLQWFFSHYFLFLLPESPSQDVTQIRGRSAGSSPPSPLRYAPSFLRGECSAALSSLVDPYRIAPTTHSALNTTCTY